jgi:hypothetical protein
MGPDREGALVTADGSSGRIFGALVIVNFVSLLHHLAFSPLVGLRGLRGWPRLGTVLAWGRARVAVQAEVTRRGEWNKKGGLRSTFRSKEAASDSGRGVQHLAEFCPAGFYS